MIVNPILNCSHIENSVKSTIDEFRSTIGIIAFIYYRLIINNKANSINKCNDCNEIVENWICLGCNKLYCGRYVNKHMLQHYNSTNHSIAISMLDLSLWCYSCNSYVSNKVIN